MLHIIDHLEPELQKDSVDQEVNSHTESPNLVDRAKSDQLARLAPEHPVAQEQARLINLGLFGEQPVSLDIPALPELSVTRSHCERINSLSFTGRGWVEGRGDPLMVALIMGDQEVSEHEAQIHNVGSELMVPLPTMT